MFLSSNRHAIVAVVLLFFFLTGCESIGYYGQAIHGQLSILNRRQPIKQLLAAPQTPDKLKARLRMVLRIRQFAAKQLDLPVKDNYLTYVALGRPCVVWNVFAAPEFSLAPKTWCFPIVGCTAYRGYFSREKAEKYAEKLKKSGLDVYVGGVTAYSTLGWFDDPVLSTIIERSTAGLAALIFHELAHQVLYVDDDTTFNESFAMAVEQEGLRRWMTATGNTKAYAGYRKTQARQRAFATLVMSWRRRLAALYEKKIPVREKRRRKAMLIAGLRNAYQDLKATWQGHAGYDRWFAEPVNNAKINTVSTYHQLIPDFRRLIRRTPGRLKRFYDICQTLADRPVAERRTMLKRMGQ